MFVGPAGVPPRPTDQDKTFLLDTKNNKVALTTHQPTTMRYTILLSMFVVFFALSAAAQNRYSVSGTIADSVEKVKLGTSAIAVLQAKDSILVKFGYAKPDGTFMLDGLRKGKY